MVRFRPTVCGQDALPRQRQLVSIVDGCWLNLSKVRLVCRWQLASLMLGGDAMVDGP